MANPNIVNISSMYGNTAVLNVSTTATSIVTNPSGSNNIYKLNSLIIANINASSSANLTVELNRNNTNTALIRNVTITAGGSFVAVAKDTPIYLMENDIIQLAASSSSILNAIASWEQIS